MKLLVANWKMNLGIKESLSLASHISRKIKNNKNKKFILLPTLHTLATLIKQKSLNEVLFGAQDCSQFDIGAYTGEVSADMIKEMGCKYVLLGHSERRKNNHENNKVLRKKLTLVNNASIKTIFCVGEELIAYNNKNSKETIRKQLSNVFPEEFDFKKLVIAYEPVWAIGKNKTPKMHEIESISNFIKKLFSKKYAVSNIPILYGGSVNTSNSRDIFFLKNIDGALVGGASLKASEFIKIYDTLN